jgi:hypothetical protein
MQLQSVPTQSPFAVVFPEFPEIPVTAVTFRYSNAVFLVVSDRSSFGTIVKVARETDPQGNQTLECRVVHGYDQFDETCEVLASAFAKPFLKAHRGKITDDFNVFLSLCFPAAALGNTVFVSSLLKWLQKLAQQ